MSLNQLITAKQRPAVPRALIVARAGRPRGPLARWQGRHAPNMRILELRSFKRLNDFINPGIL
jgi:hypothetical protein